MANNKKITVDQLQELAECIDEKFIDNEELEQAKTEIKASSYHKYVVKNTDTVTNVHGDGYAYEITVNADFSEYANHICNGGAVCFDLSEVLGITTLALVNGFNVSANDGAFLIVGDCTLLDVWYHFTLTSTTWPNA